MNRIALVLIARDEARCIERCLDSARAWVDEMWVLDTGSRDHTAALARACGAQVHHCAWGDDFSAARNTALDLTTAAWRLVLDADEWLADGGSCLNALRHQRDPFIGLIRVVSQFEDAQGRAHEAPSWLPRLLPAGVRYEGRIHEQPKSDLPRQRLDLQVAHDGYRREFAQIKQGRNRHLLELALAAAPDDAYLRYQLGKDLELNHQFEEADGHYARALQACGQRAGWRHDLVLRQLFVLKQIGQFEQALVLAESEMPHWDHSPDFYFTLGDLLLAWAAQEPQRAAELLPMIEASWLRSVVIGERPDLQDSVSGRGSWLAAHNLAVFHDSLGDAAQARHWREREALMRA